LQLLQRKEQLFDSITRGCGYIGMPNKKKWTISFPIFYSLFTHWLIELLICRHVNLFVGLGRLHPRPAHCVQGLLHLLSWCSGRTEDFLCEESSAYPKCRTTRSSPSPGPTPTRAQSMSRWRCPACPKILFDRSRQAEKIVYIVNMYCIVLSRRS
jgi:hypothetical protein